MLFFFFLKFLFFYRIHGVEDDGNGLIWARHYSMRLIYVCGCMYTFWCWGRGIIKRFAFIELNRWLAASLQDNLEHYHITYYCKSNRSCAQYSSFGYSSHCFIDIFGIPCRPVTPPLPQPWSCLPHRISTRFISSIRRNVLTKSNVIPQINSARQRLLVIPGRILMLCTYKNHTPLANSLTSLTSLLAKAICI